ncbi:MAG: hypothetical protein K9H64_15630 [Bacteroidales bacterium]|nr:hypothetical protein [Bacteroidales bacterium]MCF8457852.1 hypothetical protein [Bacteroidales bacterium]
MRKILSYLVQIVIAGFFLLSGLPQCGSVSYSLSGASIPPDAKTVSVNYFQNNAPLVNPQLSQDLTDALKDKFVSQTSLTLVNGVGDLHFEGEITGYETKPMAIKENDVAAENRLTITVRVRYVNSKDPDSKFDFDKSFSRFENYSSSKDLSQVETELTEEIVKQLVEDIFNESVVNW